MDNNIVKEEIQSIINENNIAQEQFHEILQGLNNEIKELHVDERLHGVLDLSILQENNFLNITSITFEEGELTDILNIPDNLEKLICPYNLLTELNDLPVTLRHLDLEGNYISQLDMLSIPNLTYLNINDNRISDVEPLPNKIQTLLANNNKIRSIDFAGVTNIHTIHISSNPITVIQNMPESVEDFVSEYNSSIRYENSSVPGENDVSQDNTTDDKGIKIPFNTAIQTYYEKKRIYDEGRKKEIKKIYETKQKDIRQKINAYKHPCIKCKRQVGTQFYNNNDTIIAKCGDLSDPCPLNIELKIGDFTHLQKEITELEADVNLGKTNFITLKLDSLFNYRDDEQTKKQYNERLEEYNFFSELYNETLRYQQSIYHNDERLLNVSSKTSLLNTAIIKLQRLTKEYYETDNSEYLQLITEIYIKEIQPLVKEIQQLKYQHREVEIVRLSENTHKRNCFNNYCNIVHQYVSNIDSIDSFARKQEKVKAFNM